MKANHQLCESYELSLQQTPHRHHPLYHIKYPHKVCDAPRYKPRLSLEIPHSALAPGVRISPICLQANYPDSIASRFMLQCPLCRHPDLSIPIPIDRNLMHPAWLRLPLVALCRNPYEPPSASCDRNLGTPDDFPVLEVLLF